MLGNGEAPPAVFDAWSLLELLAQHWGRLLLSGVVMAVAGAGAGLAIWKTQYVAQAQLIRFDSPRAMEVLKPRQVSPQTLASVLRAPELLQRVAAQARPALSAEVLTRRLRVTPERTADIVSIAAGAGTIPDAVALANLYSGEAVQYTQELQASEAGEINDFLKQQLAQMDKDLAALNQQWRAAPRAALQSAGRSSQLLEKLQEAREELAARLAQYTDIHPLVKDQRAKVAALENLLSHDGSPSPAATPSDVTPTSDGPPPAPAKADPNEANGLDVDSFRNRLQSLETGRVELAARQRAVEQFVESAPGFYRVFAPATPEEIIRQGRRVKVIFLSLFFGMIGVAGGLGTVLYAELTDRRMKNAGDVQRVTRLPLLATLGDLGRMSISDQEGWAFRTWTILQGRLRRHANQGLVCGFTSSARGEGRSTWMRSLARAASKRGFRVLIISAQSSPDSTETTADAPPDRAAQVQPENDGPPNPTALAATVLASPTEVTQKLVGPDAQPIVHVPIPGWVWNLERRKQWQAALNHWLKIDNVVILVDLPPASVPEAVLLGENLPQLIWVTDSGVADAAQTRAQLETLRHARCNLVGAVLNHEPPARIHNRFPRWLGCGLLCLALSPFTGKAAETNLALSAANSPKRAPWQERLTLGPGDTLNFALFGQPELTRSEVPIGPDGRVSYLEAEDILASGLTIGELRAKLDEELAKFRRNPRSVITPAAFRSKKFFMLGTVARKGVFTLDRPLTIIEAVAQGRGLETGLFDHGTRELADLPRSFLARQGKRVPVDFEKLFQEGDLSQNVPLEPGDYLFFPPASLKEIYVLGEVRAPGLMNFNPGATALVAIATRGGFTERAWKKKILVTRGSLHRPETFVVDAPAVLAARQPDFQLQPKDIVYVSARPWIKAEELLDSAATAFAQAAVIIWIGQNIGP